LLKRDDPFYGGGLRKDTLKARVPNKLTKCRQSENLLRLSGNTGVINQTTNHNIMSTWLQLGSQQNIIRETKRRRLWALNVTLKQNYDSNLVSYDFYE